MITKTDFFGYEQYTAAQGDMSVSFITLGAAVTSLKYKGRELVPGYVDAQGYLDGTNYLCAMVGRFANRIRRGQFTLNGKDYQLTLNEGKNHLHGGVTGASKSTWKAEVVGESAVKFSRFYPDGEDGYPGNMTQSVTYTVLDSCLRLDFEGDSNEDTIYAPTTHLYFNLDGDKDIYAHKLWINSDCYLTVDAELLPTGELKHGDEKFDFSTLREIGCDYDHCFPIKGEHACTLEKGGVSMDLYTDFPAMQLYISPVIGSGERAERGVAIEPEYYPDSPNVEGFEKPILRAGEHFHKYAEFRFEAK